MSMRANVLPIGDNPVFMIGADRCVEGPFGDWDMVGVAWDWGIGNGLTYLSRIGIGLADGSMVAAVLANWSNIVTG